MQALLPPGCVPCRVLAASTKFNHKVVVRSYHNTFKQTSNAKISFTTNLNSVMNLGDMTYEEILTDFPQLQGHVKQNTDLEVNWTPLDLGSMHTLCTTAASLDKTYRGTEWATVYTAGCVKIMQPPPGVTVRQYWESKWMKFLRENTNPALQYTAAAAAQVYMCAPLCVH